mmetsp:Transcript_5188/g.11318  ORF Transcript_5188/g.11318 Transcript_5188/m.11318 type:complete len:91 (+) Transcript_5188:123-395(+)
MPCTMKVWSDAASACVRCGCINYVHAIICTHCNCEDQVEEWIKSKSSRASKVCLFDIWLTPYQGAPALVHDVLDGDCAVIVVPGSESRTG